MFTGFGGSDRPETSIDDSRRPFQIYLLGTREEIQTTINQLQVVRFCERIRWSPPIPVLGSDWKYISMMERDRVTE
ncbi:hypothetical protein [Alkalinema sp. FACHB-956]|uniref:hypothetical protein n=1 Tax=Alkalinema sp. FACHB-956 TaxID=2692768 RepID=UPI001688A267|nr:hypothetical protein [Alkalinema sp. FACHB-956]MBD2329290.1 hypothetical protein [Alkalinema sp. FACHB-956]